MVSNLEKPQVLYKIVRKWLIRATVKRETAQNQKLRSLNIEKISQAKSRFRDFVFLVKLR